VTVAETNPDTFLKTEDVAVMVGMHPQHVRRLARRGVIPALRPGLREYRYRREDIERYLDDRKS
jgi:excisionase family DNA binding protein